MHRFRNVIWLVSGTARTVRFAEVETVHEVSEGTRVFSNAVNNILTPRCLLERLSRCRRQRVSNSTVSASPVRRSRANQPRSVMAFSGVPR